MRKVFLLSVSSLILCFVFIYSCKKDNSISPTGISVSNTTLTMNVGSTDTLKSKISPTNATDQVYTWRSSNSAIAIVNSTGVVTALAAGTDTIVATTQEGNFKAACLVTVIVPVTGITLSTAAITMGTSVNDTLKATIAPSNASIQTVTWRSSNTSIATVSATGVITSLAAGSDSIIATTTQGNFKAFCLVTVNTLNVGLVAYYPFKGNVLDYSGNKNNGTVYGMLTPTTDHKGNANGAYSFNGINNYVEVPDAPSLNPTTAITVSAWYSPAAFSGSGNDPILDKPFTSTSLPAYQYHLGVTGNQYPNQPSKFGFDVSPNNVYLGAATTQNFYKIGTWYHIVGTYDGSYCKIYINGVLITTNPATGTLTDYGQNIYIGKFGNLSYYLPGSIGEIRIYSRALSQSEVTTLYNL